MLTKQEVNYFWFVSSIKTGFRTMFHHTLPPPIHNFCISRIFKGAEKLNGCNISVIKNLETTHYIYLLFETSKMPLEVKISSLFECF